jgi:Spy/CpxP family protein refolding chaperone
MKLRNTVLALMAGASLICAQEPNTGQTSTLIFPPPVQAFDEVKQHLGLSDAQLQQLRDIMAERDKATQAIYEQLRVKQTELDTLLNGGSTDAARVGQLMIDINRIRRQLPLPSDQYRQRALAVLTPDQRTKLTPLDQAMKLATPAHQAVTLNLIDPPPPGRPIILRGELPAIEPTP